MKRILYILLFFSSTLFAQNKDLEWHTFETLETALVNEPRKVIIHFYADWCAYCHKMENVVYTKPAIKHILEDSYYAVKFNVESQDIIQFGGKVFKNLNVGKKRNAYHEIPELLAGRANKPIELPAIVILDEAFNIVKRYYRYIPPKELLSILQD